MMPRWQRFADAVVAQTPAGVAADRVSAHRAALASLRGDMVSSGRAIAEGVEVLRATVGAEVDWAAGFAAGLDRFEGELGRWLDLQLVRFPAIDEAITRIASGTMVPSLEGWGLDTPQDGEARSRSVVTVRGWAVFAQGPTARVDLALDGAPVGRALLGLPRHDVEERMGVAHACGSGFEFELDLTRTPSDVDEVSLELTATDVYGGAASLCEVRIPLTPATVSSATADPAPRALGRQVAKASDRGPRVLAFNHGLGTGGAELRLRDLLVHLSRAGVECTLISPKDGHLRHALEAAGVDVHVTSGLGIGSPEEYEGRQAEWASLVRRLDPDVVVADTLVAFPAVDLAERLALPCIWSIYESMSRPAFWASGYPFEAPVHPYAQARAEAALSSADALVFDSAAVAALHGTQPGDTAVVIPNAIDIDAVEAFRATTTPAQARAVLGLPHDATVVVCVGILHPRKSQIPLLHAVSLLQSAHPDVVWALVGDAGGPYSETLNRYVARARLGSQVWVVPATLDVFPWLRSADIAVCPSYSESSPAVVIEAMAFGLPVVASRSLGIAELIEDGRSGLLVEPADVAALAQGLDTMLRMKPEERTVMGRAGEAEAMARHRLDDRIAAMQRLIESHTTTARR